jgi:cell division protein FtsX
MILKVVHTREKVMVLEILVQVDLVFLEMTVLIKKLKTMIENIEVVDSLQKETKEDDKDLVLENLVQDEEVVTLQEEGNYSSKKEGCNPSFLLLNYNYT